MKKLISAVAVCLVSVNAFAQWERSNDIGGKLVLADSKCLLNGKWIDGLSQVYSFNKNGSHSIRGCWTVYDGYIHVTWEDGDRSMYPLSGWTKTK